MALTVEAPTRDRFGNPLDDGLGYARGAILRTAEDDVTRFLHGHALLRDRVARHGPDSVYNLTGLTRAFALDPGDEEKLASHLHFYTHFEGRAEPVAVRYMGGEPGPHAAVIVNRVSTGTLATMLALVPRGERVLSSVPRGRSHPSVRNGVLLAGSTFEETVGLAATLRALDAQPAPALVAITTITPQKQHYPQHELERIVHRAHERGAIVFLDDAHMVTRVAFHDQALPFALGPVDVAVCSTDKHIVGPRNGILVGRSGLIERIRAVAYEYGFEAQYGMYVAVLRALERFDPAPVAAVRPLSAELLERFRARYGAERVVSAGPGLVIGEEDVADLVVERSGGRVLRLVPAEVTSAVGMALVEEAGLCTIHVIGMPGMSAVMRLLMFPDGPRAGVERIEQGFGAAIERVAALIDQPDAASRLILGR